MIETTQAWKDNIYIPTEKKIQFTIGDVTLTDDDIQGSVEISETCSNAEDIKIGSCIASKLKFNYSNKSVGRNLILNSNEDVKIQGVRWQDFNGLTWEEIL